MHFIIFHFRRHASMQDGWEINGTDIGCAYTTASVNCIGDPGSAPQTTLIARLDSHIIRLFSVQAQTAAVE
jgi:hypothetical protein